MAFPVKYVILELIIGKHLQLSLKPRLTFHFLEVKIGFEWTNTITIETCFTKKRNKVILSYLFHCIWDNACIALRDMPIWTISIFNKELNDFKYVCRNDYIKHVSTCFPNTAEGWCSLTNLFLFFLYLYNLTSKCQIKYIYKDKIFMHLCDVQHFIKSLLNSRL